MGRGASRRIAVLLAMVVFVAGCSASRAAESEQIARALRLEPGMEVADVGAGDGEWTVELARLVGETGKVYATEVKESLVEEIRETVGAAGLFNVTPILGHQDSIGLPADCCDAILLRLVYHHFTSPVPMRADLRNALRADGLLAIVDIVPQEGWRELPGVPDRGGHGIPVADLILELEGDGFELVERIDRWNDDEDRFCIVFRRALPADVQ